MAFIVCSHYHLMVALLVAITLGSRETLILARTRFADDFARKLRDHFSIELRYLREDEDIGHILASLAGMKLVVFTHGDLRSLEVMNRFRGDVYLAEDGSFPYYRNYRSYDNYDARSAKAAIKRLVFPHRLINYRRKLAGLFLTRPELSDPVNLEKRIGKIDIGVLGEENWLKLDDLFGVVGYPRELDTDVVLFDSSIEGEFELPHDDVIALFDEILSSLSALRVLFRFSPLLHPERDPKMREMLRTHANVIVDETNAHRPWELVYRRNLRTMRGVVHLSQRCTALFSGNLFYCEQVSSIAMNELFFDRFKFRPAVVEDHLYFNRFLTSEGVRRAGVHARIARSVGEIREFALGMRDRDA